MVNITSQQIKWGLFVITLVVALYTAYYLFTSDKKDYDPKVTSGLFATLSILGVILYIFFKNGSRVSVSSLVAPSNIVQPQAPIPMNSMSTISSQ
jgi:bacteriorhodopsin